MKDEGWKMKAKKNTPTARVWGNLKVLFVAPPSGGCS
jgi:hypothetical protein